jgi:predicted lysophospholipase L1 biosynthesis ABC-type transport system permease subunit
MRFFPDRPPVLDVAAGMREIVGVVRDIRHGGLTSDAVPEMFVPYAQKPVHDMTLVVRTSTDPASLAGPARAVIAKLDPDQPVARIETMASIVSTAIAQPRANSLLLAAFAVTALGLSLVGIYGLLAYVVAQRLPELGIRLALGADPAALRRLILAQGLRLVAAGVAAGSAGSLLLTRALGAALPGLEPADPWLIGAAIAALAIPAIAACDLPARAATRVDPVSVLKSA